MTDERQEPAEASVHPWWTSRQTRTHAESILAPLTSEESDNAVRQAIEAVTADGSARAERLTVYPPTIRVEKPAQRDEAPRRLISVSIRDTDRRVVHEIGVGDGIVVDHQVNEHGAPPVSDEELATAQRLLSDDARFRELLADAAVSIEWFSPGHGPDRQLGARLVRTEGTRVVEDIDSVVVDLDTATIIEGGDRDG